MLGFKRISNLRITSVGHLVWDVVPGASGYRLTLGGVSSPVSTPTPDINLTGLGLPTGPADVKASLEAWDASNCITCKDFEIHCEGGTLEIKKSRWWIRALPFVAAFAFLAIVAVFAVLYFRIPPMPTTEQPEVSAPATNAVAQKSAADSLKEQIAALQTQQASPSRIKLDPEATGEQASNLTRQIQGEIDRLDATLLKVTKLQGDRLNEIANKLANDQHFMKTNFGSVLNQLASRVETLNTESAKRFTAMENEMKTLKEKVAGPAAAVAKPEPPSGLTITPSPHVVVPGPSSNASTGSITAGPSGSTSLSLMTPPQGGITINSSNTYIQAPGGLFGWRPEVPAAGQGRVPAQEMCLKVPSQAPADAVEGVSFWIPLGYTPVNVMVDPGWELHISGIPAGVRVEGFLRNCGFIPYDPYDTRFLTKEIEFLRFSLQPGFRPLYIETATLPADMRSTSRMARPTPSPCP